MENQGALDKLSSEQRAALSEELAAVYCTLAPGDQDFFARSFSPKDLPTALTRKAEILKRDAAYSARLKATRDQLAAAGEASPTPVGEDVVTAAAAALGIGAGAVIAATDNTAFYNGVQPSELIPTLATEFNNSRTSLTTSGSPDAMTATVNLRTSGGVPVPAMTILLTRLNEGCEVKINELSQQSILEMLKSGAQRLIDLAEDGLNLLRGRGGDVLGSASDAVNNTAGLAEVVGNLKLKERAWKVIKPAAEAIEKNFQAEKEQQRQAQAALESAWDRYYNCPTCAVPFGPEDIACRVCLTARPEAPVTPDPRKQ